MRNSLTVTIEKVLSETPDIKTLFFKRSFDFMAGQCISVYFDDLAVPEGRAYSLSSLPSDNLASISVKDVGGLFSSKLCRLQPGDKLEISSAYGFFNPETELPLVAIVAGVGLSPAWTILASRNDQRDKLHYINKTEADIMFREKLDNLATTVSYYITRQADTKYHNGRPDVAEIVKNSDKAAHFLICGSVDFVRQVFRQIEEAGIEPERISSEVFFEQHYGM